MPRREHLHFLRQLKALHQEGGLLPVALPLLAQALEQESGRPTDLATRTRLATHLTTRCAVDHLPCSAQAAVPVLPSVEFPGFTGEVLLDVLTLLDPGTGRRGQVFTPWPLALHMARLLDPEPGQRWLDPAAGAGIFLQAAVHLGAAQEKCAALEVDPLARELGHFLLPGSHWIQQNALAPWEDLPRDWRGAFHRLILNPPFRNAVEARDEGWVAWRAQLKEGFATARGAFDLYMPFVERALDLLTPGGRLGLVAPMAWLASGSGRALRRLLVERHGLLQVQHAPGVRLFPRADLDALVLVVEAHVEPCGHRPPVVVTRLDGDLRPVASHFWPQGKLAEWVEEGWGPLLWPPQSQRQLRTKRLGEGHQVSASLSTAEYYHLQVMNSPAPREGEARLYSSGAIEAYHATWGSQAVRFRKERHAHPVVPLDSLPSARQAQVMRPRVLIANLSRELEALAVAPGEALGVVNVIQVFCADMARAHALAAWLNSAALREWVRLHFDPLRLHTQLSLTRDLVRRLPAPPASGPDARRLADHGAKLALEWAAGRGLGADAKRLQHQVDALVERWLPRVADRVG